MDRAASFFCIIGNCMLKYQTPNILLGKVICSFYFPLNFDIKNQHTICI